MLPPTDSISVAIFSAVRVGGAFQQRLGEQLRDAVVRRCFHQHAALERRAEFHERQPVVLLYQQAQAVRQCEFLDRLVGCSFQSDVETFGDVPFGQQRVERAVLRREIFAGDALDIVRLSRA